MAVLAISAAGAVAGGGVALGAGIGAVSTFMSIGWAVGSFIGQMFFGPEPPHQTIEGPRLSDLEVQTSTYGAAIPECWGSGRMAGNVIWSTGLQETKHEEHYEQESGKGLMGGGGATTTKVTYTYSVSCAIGICKGPIAGIRRVWADGKLIYDKDNSSSYNVLLISDTRFGDFEIHLGTPTQDPSSIIESYEGAGEVPAHRGLAYMAVDKFPLEDFGNRMPNFSFEKVDGTGSQEAYFETDSAIGHGDQGLALYQGNYISAEDNKIVVYDGFSGTVIKTFSTSYAGTSGWSGIRDLTVLDGDLIVTCYETGGSHRSAIIVHDGVSPSVKQTQLISDFWIYTLAAGPDGVLYGVATVWTYANPAMYAFYDYGSTKLLMFEWPSSLTLPDGSNCGYARPFGSDITPDGDLIHLIGCGATVKVIKADGISLDFTDMMESYPVPSFGGASGVNPRGIVHDPRFGHAVLKDHANDIVIAVDWDGDIATLGTLSHSDADLADINNDLLEDAGISSANRDMSALSGTSVTGYVKSKPMSTRKAIEPLQQAYQYDLVEMDYQIVAVLRGGASGETITEDECGAAEAGNPVQDAIQTQIGNEIEVPREIRVRYMAQGRDYQPGIQRSIMPTSNSRQKVQIDLPVVLSDDEGKQIAEIIHQSLFNERVMYRFALTMEYATVAPSDIITVDGRLMRVAAMQIAGTVLQIEAAGEDASAYSSSASGESPPFDDQTVTVPSPTEVLFLDCPLLRDQDNRSGMYVAAYGWREGWRGCVIYASDDGGETWSSFANIASEATVGVCQNTLGDGPTTVWDEGNTLSVELQTPGASLNDSTKAGVLADNTVNAALVGSDGAWEVINFVNATEESDGTWTLDTFLRGRKGTRWAVDGHSSDEWFVLLNTNIVPVPIDLDFVATQRRYKIVSVGLTTSSGYEKNFTYNGVRLEPVEVSHIEGSRDASGNLTITWVRGSRIGTAWRDRTDVPLGEVSELYKVEILDAPGGTVQRTFDDETSETVTYTDAQQTTDFGSVQDVVYVKIYQKSDDVGTGYGREATL